MLLWLLLLIAVVLLVRHVERSRREVVAESFVRRGCVVHEVPDVGLLALREAVEDAGALSNRNGKVSYVSEPKSIPRCRKTRQVNLRRQH